MKYARTLFFFACLSLLVTACTLPSGLPVTALSVKPETLSTKATVVLLHAPQGIADLTWDRHKQTLTVMLQVQGLTPNSSHPTHLHLGTCTAPGSMLYALPPLLANGLGQARMNMALPHVTQLPNAFLVNIHNGPTMAAAQNQNLAIACGAFTLKTSGAFLQERAILHGTLAPNESVSGTAQLTLDPTGLLHVTVHAHGLLPGSTHAIHIHTGNCNQQGAMLYPLTPLVADPQGNAQETVLIPYVKSIPTSGWYLNLHFAETIATPQGKILSFAFNPIACGNVN